MSSMPEACCRFTSARLGKRSHPAPLDAGAAQEQEIPENSCCWPLHAPAAQTQPQTAPAAAGFKPAVLGALSCCTRTIVPFDRDRGAKHRTARLVRRLRRCARHESRHGPANGKAHALASRFRHIKRFKKVFQLSVAQPHAGVSCFERWCPAPAGNDHAHHIAA